MFWTWRALAVAVGLGWLGLHAQAAAAASWSQAAFAGHQVALVRVNQAHPNEMMASVDSRAYVSISGGLLWDESDLAGVPTVIAYDSVHPGMVYAGTTHGLFVSANRGLNWQPFVAHQFGMVKDLVVGRDDVFATIAQSGNSTPQVFRITRGGTEVALASPELDPGPLAYDPYNNALYLSGDDAIDRSLDDGATWVNVGPLFQVGQGSVRLQVKNGLVAQLSWNTGPFATGDGGASWQRLVNRVNTREMYFLFHSFAGLAINHGHLFYGLYSYDAGTQDMYEADASGGNVMRLGLNQLVTDVATGDNQLWAATTNGLWVNLDLVSSEAQVQRPVIIIPGVVGSWKIGGQYVLDPITHTYDPLIKMLRDAGYAEGLTLFPFGYDWRQDNNVTAELLRTKIAQVRLVCGCAQVDVIGHSMGGLVARAYVEGDGYANDVANLIELGTPNAGAVEDYSVWENGTSSRNNIKDRLEFWALNLLAYERGYANIFDYVHHEVPSTQQLLPIFNYIDGRTYPHSYPTNPFLGQLNSADQVAKLDVRTHLVLIGSDTLDTLDHLQVKDSVGLNRWQDGEIVDKTYGPGDGMVPFRSFTSIAPADLVLNLEHGDLVKKPDQGILTYLMTDFEMTEEQAVSNPAQILIVYVKSPVKISVADDQGDKLDDLDNSIPGAFYTGSDGEAQFATIADPNGTYHILTGADVGKYTVGVSLMSDNNETNQELTGQTAAGQVDGFEWDGSALKLTSTTAVAAVGYVIGTLGGLSTADSTSSDITSPASVYASALTSTPDGLYTSRVNTDPLLISNEASLHKPSALVVALPIVSRFDERPWLIGMGGLAGILAVGLWLILLKRGQSSKSKQ